MKRTKSDKLFAKQKAKYRRSSSWSTFRAEMIHANPVNCLTGLPYSGTCTLHHKVKCTTIEQYMDKDCSKYSVLQSSQHSLLHELARLKAAPGSILAQIQEIIRPIVGDDWIYNGGQSNGF